MDTRLQRMRSESERLRARKFWSDQNAWPFDTSGYVFIPRAIDALGKILFADEWPTDILNIRKSPRIEDVVLALRENFAVRRLSGAIQRYDGTFEPLPAEIWNTRDYEQWFNTDFRAPITATGRYGHPLANIPECWLFVERDGLEALKVGTADTVSVPSEPCHLSPYLRLMIAVSHELEISPDHQPKKAEVEAKIREVSKRPGMPTMGTAAVGYAATFIREVESQAGAASNSRRTR